VVIIIHKIVFPPTLSLIIALSRIVITRATALTECFDAGALAAVKTLCFPRSEKVLLACYHAGAVRASCIGLEQL